MDVVRRSLCKVECSVCGYKQRVKDRDVLQGARNILTMKQKRPLLQALVQRRQAEQHQSAHDVETHSRPTEQFPPAEGDRHRAEVWDTQDECLLNMIMRRMDLEDAELATAETAKRRRLVTTTPTTMTIVANAPKSMHDAPSFKKLRFTGNWRCELEGRREMWEKVPR